MSVIGEALRRAEEEQSPAAIASNVEESAASAKGIAHEQAWSVTVDQPTPWLTVTLAVMIVAAAALVAWPGSAEAPVVAQAAVPSPQHSLDAKPVFVQADRPQVTAQEDFSIAAFLADIPAEEPSMAETPADPPVPVQRAQPLSPPPASKAATVRVETATSFLAEQYQLEGVILSGQTRHAVVNGMIVEVGHRIGEGIVREIDRKCIIVEVEGTKHRIPLRAGTR